MPPTPVSCHEAARWMIEVAKALQYAHARSVFHLDVKPANILFQGDNLARGPQRILLADFGLALRDHHRLGADRRVSGTPAYMSPEQARGESERIGPQPTSMAWGRRCTPSSSAGRLSKATRTRKSWHQSRV